jgi:hypothetical protein
MVALLAAPHASAQEQVVFEDTGAVKVVTGQACGSMAGQSRTFKSTFNFLNPFAEFSPEVRLGPNISIDPMVMDRPNYADQSLVFLNGFRASFTSKDHHVRSMGASLGRELPDPKIPGGVELADKGTDDTVEGCFFYVGIAWSTAALSNVVITNLTRTDRFREATRAEGTWEYGPVSGRRIALPTGYLMTANRGDRHLIQYAFNLIQDPPADLQGTINAQAIMKDNDDSSRINFYADFVLMVGINIRFMEGPFELDYKNGSCGFFSSCTQTGRRTPYRQARRLGADENEIIIPVLTGFDLNSSNDDDHIKHVGAWIDGYSYDPNGRVFQWSENADFRDKGDSVFNQRLKVGLLRLDYKPVRPQAHTSQDREVDFPEPLTDTEDSN